MRRSIASIIILAALLPVLAACKQENYTEHLSEVRQDIFCAQTDDFVLLLNCTSREYPYADDGIACTMTQIIEVTLTPMVSPSGTLRSMPTTEVGAETHLSRRCTAITVFHRA